MSKKPKLNDVQLILLSTAAQRDDGNVLPVAESIANNEDRIRKAVPLLLKRGLVEEQSIKDRRLAWREDEERPVGLFITPASRQLIAPAEDGEAANGLTTSAPAAAKKSPQARGGSKAELVLGLLRRPEGATLNELVDATGWLPHTTRAALTGLRKKGHVLDKSKREDATCYRIAEAA